MRGKQRKRLEAYPGTLVLISGCKTVTLHKIFTRSSNRGDLMFAGLHQTKDAVSRPRYFDPRVLPSGSLGEFPDGSITARIFALVHI